MNDSTHLLSTLLTNDATVWTDGDRLHFEGPEDVITGEVVEALKRHKPRLLEWLSGADARRHTTACALPSHIQQELWHRLRHSPCPQVYGVPLDIHFDGPFAPETLERALNLLIQRHEALRSDFISFPAADGPQPVLRVRTAAAANLALVDLSGLPESERQAALEAHCRALVDAPIPVGEAPLWRASLVRLAPERHVLTAVVHHIICDGTAIAIVCDELLTAYEAISRGGLPDWEPVALTHNDFARWQRRMLSGNRLAKLTAYWRDELAGAPIGLDFATDRPRPAVPSGRGASHEFTLPAATLRGLRDTARRLETTLYVVLLSGYAAMLSEFTGQDEVVVPMSHANRAEPGHQHVVGMLMDRTPIRIRVRDASGFGELAAQVGRAVFDAMDHQALPWGHIMAALPPRQRPDPPYPTALFTVLDGHGGVRQLPGVAVRRGGESPGDVARMEFYCFMMAGPEGLRGAVEYSTDLFDAGTVERWVNRFVTILNDIATGKYISPPMHQ